MDNLRPSSPGPSSGEEGPEPLSFFARFKKLLIGPPRDLQDDSLYHRILLVAFLAWVGLGADGLSSAAYGPEEGFRALGKHTYLALSLALITGATVLLISAAYSRIIEHFPNGGGGYLVATKLLGKHAGLVSGSALLVDYILTITISIAAAGDALFSLFPAPWLMWKFPAEIFLILFLMVLNLRGVRESIVALAPIFFLFLLVHLVLIGGGLVTHVSDISHTSQVIHHDFVHGLSVLGAGGMILLLVHAYSLGGGTYTGIEAVSNGLTLMRKPRVQTGKRTMLYMGSSLAIAAAGLLICYLLWNISPVEGKTMNAVLAEKFAAHLPFGSVFVILVLASEAAILLVAAQAGFLGGPRVLANMAIDSWVPHRFAALSERLTTQNGIILMGLAGLAALLYTRGDVHVLVVMYSINVFITFTLSMLGMLRQFIKKRSGKGVVGGIVLFSAAFLLCAVILVVTTLGKFGEGGWITLLITGGVVGLCLMVRRHYDRVSVLLARLYEKVPNLPRIRDTKAEADPKTRTAVVLVSDYNGSGLHTFLNVFRFFPNYYKSVVFVSVGVIDSKEFKGEETVEALEEHVKENLQKYVHFARGQGLPASSRMSISTDAVDEAVKLCLEVSKEFPYATFFAGKVLFEREGWYQKFLHNETAFAIQKRLQWLGKIAVVVPIRIREAA